MLKLLNQVALLLVREHEVVGVLPKSYGPEAIVQLVVATGSDSDSPDTHAGVGTGPDTFVSRAAKVDAAKYVIARNSRKESALSDDCPDILQQLDAATTGQQLLGYLNTYRNVSFSSHLASIELLLNKIITSPPRQRLATRALFTRYITFRSVHKMCRRFNSPAFQSCLSAMHDVTKTQISAALRFDYQGRSSDAHLAATPTSKESLLIAETLFFRSFDRSTCPYLVAQLQAGEPLVYTPDTAFEFHQILLFVQKMAIDSVSQLSLACKSTDTDCREESLTNTVLWMDKLHKLVQCSLIFKEHMDVLEYFVSNYHPRRLSPERGPLATKPKFKEDNDQDNGPSDATIEISEAHATHRVTHKSLWLAVSYQEAIDFVTRSETLPGQSLKLTLWEPPVAIAQQTVEMDHWKDIIKSMYPADSEAASDHITWEEVIDTLRDYARQHSGRSKFFLCTPRFPGCYHAEAMLATLVHLGVHHPGTAATSAPTEVTLSDQDLTPFHHTFRYIGVSKRCCPICTKLLSLLSAGHNFGQPPLRVLYGHEDIYPTALPPFVPEEIAEALIVWLEGLVRSVVTGLVKKRRRVSGKSGDSKGDSLAHRSTGEEEKGEEEEEGESEEEGAVVERVWQGWTLEGGGVTYGVWG